MIGLLSSDVRSLIAPIGGLIGRCNLRATRRRRVCEVILVLFNLMQDLQLHRGLSGAVLGGQGAFRGEFEAVQYKLQRSLHALADHYGDKHPVFRSAQWRIVLGRWESLRNNWRELSFDTNLALHGEVVVGLIGILRVLGSENSALLGDERSRVVRSWPRLVEHLGMLRALAIRYIGGAGGQHDPALEAALRSRLQMVRCSLQHVAPHTNDPSVVAASEAALQILSQALDGRADLWDGLAVHAEMTRLIEDWFGLIRTRIQGPPAGPERALPGTARL